MTSACFRRNDCRLCHSNNLVQVLSLAPTPPANALLKRDQLSQIEEKFPLDVFLCETCGHVQLLDVVNPELLFRNYVYVSGTSPVFIEHFRQLSETIRNRFDLRNDSLVVEIGSNDGTLLRFFKEMNLQILGVDPALKIAEQATRQGIPTMPEFFTTGLAKDICEKHGKAKIVLANNVFAHTDGLEDITNGIRDLLTHDGVFIFEVSYLVDVIEKTLFDTIYHEHTAYHSLKPLVGFFERHGLELFDAERVSSHGGSLRGFVQLKGGPRQRSSNINELLALEKQMNLDLREGFTSFEKNISTLGRDLKKCIAELKASGKRIAGYGAPAKATTLLHHFGIKTTDLEYIIDDSPWKQGLYSPGLHIPIVSSQALTSSPPDYLLILAWNFADSIIQKNNKYYTQGGRFIVPVPKLRIVS